MNNIVDNPFAAPEVKEETSVAAEWSIWRFWLPIVMAISAVGLAFGTLLLGFAFLIGPIIAVGVAFTAASFITAGVLVLSWLIYDHSVTDSQAIWIGAISGSTTAMASFLFLSGGLTTFGVPVFAILITGGTWAGVIGARSGVRKRRRHVELRSDEESSAPRW